MLLDRPAGGVHVELHGPAREVVRVQVAQDQVGVGDRRLPSPAPVAGRPRRRARALGPHGDHAQGGPGEGAAAGADLDQVDGLDVHRDPASRGEAYLVELEGGGGEGFPLLDEGELGGGPAHVEGDQIAVAGELAIDARHEGAGRRPRLDHAHGVALHGLGRGDPARGLHDEEPGAGAAPSHGLLEAPEVLSHGGHDVGVDDGGAGPLVLSEGGGNLVGSGHGDIGGLFSDDLRNALFMHWVYIAVEEAHRNGRDPLGGEGPDHAARLGLVERQENAAVGQDALGDLADQAAGDQRGGRLDLKVVHLVALLAADDQDVPKSPGREQRDVLPFALDHDVGAERGSVDRLGEVAPGDAGARDELVEPLEAGQRWIGVGREPLAGVELPGGRLKDEVGERPPYVEAYSERHRSAPSA